MYRDDDAAREARGAQLRKALAEAAERKSTLVSERARLEVEARRGRFALLMRWWGIALILLAAALGITVGSALHTRHEIVVKRCQETR